MRTFKQLREKGRCWPGYKPVPGKTAFSLGSCRKENHVKELEDGLQKLDSHDYNTIDSLMTKISKDHDITGKSLHNDFKEKHGKTPDNWIKQKKLNEDLRKWFKQKWVRMDTKGNIKGDCAREPGEGKPKCLPQAKAQSIGKDARASAAQRKRREDPNPERRGSPINVKTEGTVFEKWSQKYKKTIDCNNPKGFSQKAHCQGQKKNEEVVESAAAAIAAATAIAKKKSGNYDSEGFRKTPYKNPNHPLRKSNAQRETEQE